MRNVERRRAVGVRLSEEDLPLTDDAIDVKDASRNELFEQIRRLIIAQALEPWPKFVGHMNFLHSDAGSLRARLEQPRRGNTRHKFANFVVVQDVHELWNQYAFLLGSGAHGQLVAEIANGRQAHARDA